MNVKINIRIWFFLALAMFLILVGINYRSKLKSEIRGLNNVIEVSNKVIRNQTDERGRIIAERDSYALTASQAKDQADNLFENNKELEKKIRGYKNLVSHLEGQLSVIKSDTVTLYDTITITSSGDTLKSRVFNYDDSFLTMNGIIHKNTLSFTHSYQVAFTSDQYWKRQGLMKPKTLVVDFTLADPNASMTSAQSLYILPPPKKVYERNSFWGLTGFIVGLLVR